MSAIRDQASDDDDIAEVFVEEAGEVLENIDRNFAVWRVRPTDKAALTEIRRGFHTLKGSGRMVKALDLGELAWKVENMLNRALEGTVPASEPMVGVVSTARGLMPKLLDAFKHQRKPDNEAEIEALMTQADALAAGQTPPSAAARPAAAPAAGAGAGAEAEGVPIRMSELYRRLERHAQRADEALHRSEMALQTVRRLTTQIQNLEGDHQDRVSRADVNPLIERINTLTKEMLELRLAAKKERPEAASPNPRELVQLIDQRVKEKVAHSERFRTEMERHLTESQRAVAAARSLAVWALVVAGAALAAAAAAGAFLMIG